MSSLRNCLRNALISLMVLLQAFLPATAVAQSSDTPDDDPADSTTQSAESETEEEEEDETPVAASATATGPTEPVGPQEPTGPQTPTGPTKPTGVDGNTFVYNEATKLWENDHYTWDPVTKQTKPKQKQDYSYNPLTGMWDTKEWYFNPATNKYEENKISTATNPNAKALSGGNGASISGTGPNSNNQIDLGGNNTGTFDLFFDASISNKIGQMSQSGDATVQNNLQGGSATSGDAETLLNLLNMIQSSWGDLGSQDIATFMANIDGDVYGDLMIDPNGIGGGSGNTDIDINVSKDASIRNDVDVSAQSGDANVRNNTKGGSAKSGDARALVNLINMINSAINANKSFVGVLNINGNLEGDILLPPNLLRAIIASSGPSSNNTINGGGNNNLDVNVNSNKTIDNNIDATATSGNADVSGNTNAGSAKTGKADTNIRLLNLTGHRVVAKNAMIVFVNVLGEWVGLIMDAPAGTTSAAITDTGPGSNNTIDATGNTDVDVDVDENSTIQNNITASATSGDAGVNNNTNGGDATSGDASVDVNILNMIDSDFQISDWFGVLFINVFGTWKGSFGVDTAFGNGGRGGGASTAAAGSGTETTTAAAASEPQTFAFIPRGAGSTSAGVVDNAAVTTDTPAVASEAVQETPAETAAETMSNATRNWWLAGFSLLAFLILIGAERLSTRRNS